MESTDRGPGTPGKGRDYHNGRTPRDWSLILGLTDKAAKSQTSKVPVYWDPGTLNKTGKKWKDLDLKAKSNCFTRHGGFVSGLTQSRNNWEKLGVGKGIRRVSA